VALSLASSGLHAQDKKPDFKVPDDVAFHKANSKMLALSSNA
jgi:hypothetical protein